jgi:7-keto-8-aminopelargonate synthetase-like enzyme
LFREGFYSSAVFFPIVARNQAGLRVMVRSDMSEQDIRRFAALVKDFVAKAGMAADGVMPAAAAKAA